MSDRISAILITGLPGVGKTTAVKKLSTDLTNKSVAVGGFYTEEVRNVNNVRVGFDVVSLSGKRNILARTSECDKTLKKPKIGRYNVHIDTFEMIALESLSQKADVLLIDEIGKMELLSRTFEQKMRQLLLEVRGGKINLIATIPCGQTIKLIEDLKALENAKLFNLHNSTYNDILKSCFDMLKLSN